MGPRDEQARAVRPGFTGEFAAESGGTVHIFNSLCRLAEHWTDAILHVKRAAVLAQDATGLNQWGGLVASFVGPPHVQIA